jgi:hypothetical protein
LAPAGTWYFTATVGPPGEYAATKHSSTLTYPLLRNDFSTAFTDNEMPWLLKAHKQT